MQDCLLGVNTAYGRAVASLPAGDAAMLTDISFFHTVFRRIGDYESADASLQHALLEELVPEVTFDLEQYCSEDRRTGRLLLSIESEHLLRTVYEALRVRDAAVFVQECLLVYNAYGLRPFMTTLIALDQRFIRRLADLQRKPVLVRLLLGFAGAISLARRPGQWEFDSEQAERSISLVREHFVCQRLYRRALHVWSSEHDLQLEQQRRTFVQAVAQLREAVAGAGPGSVHLLQAQVVALEDQLHRQTAEFRARIHRLVAQLSDLSHVADTLGQAVQSSHG